MINDDKDTLLRARGMYGETVAQARGTLSSDMI